MARHVVAPGRGHAGCVPPRAPALAGPAGLHAGVGVSQCEAAAAAGAGTVTVIVPPGAAIFALANYDYV